MLQPWHKTRKIEKLNSQQRSEITRLADELFAISSEIKIEFLDAIAELSDAVDGAAIIEYLRNGEIVEAIAVVSPQIFGDALTPLSEQITGAALNSGKNAGKQIPTERVFSFGKPNPATVEFLRNYRFDLIQQLSDEGRKAVALTITQGMKDGLNPITIARDVRANIGLTERQAQAVINYRRALESGTAASLTRQLRNRTFDASVLRAAQSGVALSQSQIDKMVAAYQKRYLKYRAETIARTEGARAQSFGNHEAWQQAIDNEVVSQDDIVREWIYTHDPKVRHAHKTIMEMNPNGVGWGEPFKSELGDIMYPGDPDAEAANTINCRCAVFLRHRPK
jgi:hypothetical protein